jgi:hypothetical protein
MHWASAFPLIDKLFNLLESNFACLRDRLYETEPRLKPVARGINYKIFLCIQIKYERIEIVLCKSRRENGTWTTSFNIFHLHNAPVFFFPCAHLWLL